jgi:uncharacterized MnhB-related membrane protein
MYGRAQLKHAIALAKTLLGAADVGTTKAFHIALTKPLLGAAEVGAELNKACQSNT